LIGWEPVPAGATTTATIAAMWKRGTSIQEIDPQYLLPLVLISNYREKKKKKKAKAKIFLDYLALTVVTSACEKKTP
jgi:hypothetical protein